MKITFLLIFIISSIIHLFGSYKDNKTIRNYSKALILIGLIGFYVYSVEDINLLLVAALFFSWLGDVLLIPKGVKWFTAGGISFMISHLLFITVYYPHIAFSEVNWIVVVIAFLIYFFFVNKEFKALKPHLPKGLFVPMYIYLLINMTNNLFAWMMFLSNMNLASILVLVGAISFFISDSLLFLVRFHVQDLVPKRHFFVMLTYIIAEFLIVYGLMLF